jgi:methionyl-tRNA formyltransferase
MKTIVVVGQKWFGAAVFKTALAAGLRVAAVCAPPGDRLAAAAEAASVPVVPMIDIPSVDLGVLAHAHVFIGPEARARAGCGFIGYHPSLLPRHRGRDAVRWTIHRREPIAGGSIYRVEDKVDAGPVLLADWCHVHPGDDAAELWRRYLAPMGLRLFGTLFAQFAADGTLPEGRPQDETLATWEPAFARERLVAETR